MLQLQDFLGMDSENFRTLLAWRCLIAQKKKKKIARKSKLKRLYYSHV